MGLVNWMNGHWGLTLAAGLIAGAVGTFGALRIIGRRTVRGLKRRVSSREIVWGCHAREHRYARAHPFSGVLIVGEDGMLRFEPDAYSVKHGATQRTWRLQGNHLSLGRRWPDISGYWRQALTVSGLDFVEALEYTAMAVVGELP